MNPKQRVQFKKQAENLYKQSLKQESTVRKGIERIATGYGLKPENIFYEPTESQPTAPTTEAQPKERKFNRQTGVLE